MSKENFLKKLEKQLINDINMNKIIKIMLFFMLTSCSTQNLALQDNWEECMNCGEHFTKCIDISCQD